jgi:glycosyltransferase involved in cell wall biosynthesis
MVSTGYLPIYPNRIGAIEPFIYGLSKNLSLTNSVTVFGIGKGEEKIGNLHIQTFPYSENVLTSLKSICGPRLAYQIPFNSCLVESIFNLNKKNPIDILHIHDANSGFAATLSKLALNIPYVCSVHNEVRSALSIRACTKVLAVSEYIRHFLIEKRKLDPKKIGILDVAIDLEVYNSTKSIEQAKKELGLENQDVVLFVGRKCPEKGPQVLIEALKKIALCNPRVLVILVGPDYIFSAVSKNCNYTNFLVEKAEKLSVKKNVLFKGFLSDYTLRLYYNAADICVFPSVWPDPCPTVLKEALAFKKPVVASNVGGIPEIIKHEYNGLLVPPNDPAGLAEAINLLLANREYARRLGENGRKDVESKFSFEVVGKECAKIYRALV